MKVKQITQEAVKITAVDTNTGNVTYKDDVTGVTTTVPKGMATPTAQGQVQVSAQQVAPGQPGSAFQPTVKVGDQVKVTGQTPQTQQTMGSMEEDGEQEIPKEGALLLKLAKVVKSVQTPEQYETAKKYARLMFDKLKAPYYGSFADKDMDNMKDLMNSINSDLRAKRQELDLGSTDMYGQEFDLGETDSIPQVGQPEDDQQMEAIKKLAGL